MTKIIFKATASTLLAGAAMAAATPAFAQTTGGNGAGDPTTEVCTQNTSLGSGAVACGASSTASGSESTATGYNSTATGTRSTATGAISIATGGISTATGYNSIAGDASTALGGFSNASARNSVALGANSVANVADTVSVGRAADGTNRAFQRQIVNMAAGAVTATSTDAVNGSQLFATNSRVSALEALSFNASSQIAGLQTGLNSLSDQLTINNRQTNGGIAAALALGGAAIVPDSNVSMSFNLSTYRGQQGFSGSLIGRVSEKVYITGGFAGSTVKGSTGGRIGITFGM
jgi:trimeric autotransporter adhesin